MSLRMGISTVYILKSAVPELKDGSAPVLEAALLDFIGLACVSTTPARSKPSVLFFCSFIHPEDVGDYR